jgi:hypothetical protein
MAQKNKYKKNLSDSIYFHEHYDQCTFPGCNYKFQEADWTYLGIDTTGHRHHVCEKHRGSNQWIALQILGHLSKTSYRIEPYEIPCYSEPPQPNIDLWLWRYMNFNKFKDFIDNKSIFFAKVASFHDPLECAVSIKRRQDWLYLLRVNSYQYFYESTLCALSPKEKMDAIEEKIQNEIKINQDFREKVLISCWHANDYESEAMWQLYKGKKHQTVAISINMCNLRNALPQPIHLGKVSYEDYERVYPTKIRAFKKHISYEHENEIRAIIFPEYINEKSITDITIKKVKNGILIKPDENYLQIRVYISPWCDNCFREKVNNLISNSTWNKGDQPNPSIVEVIETSYDPIY